MQYIVLWQLCAVCVFTASCATRGSTNTVRHSMDIQVRLRRDGALPSAVQLVRLWCLRLHLPSLPVCWPASAFTEAHMPAFRHFMTAAILGLVTLV